MKSRQKGRTIASGRPGPRRDPQTDFSIGRSYHVAFSPDGRRLVTVSRDVVLREARDGRRIAVARPFPHRSAVAYAPDGDAIVVKNTSGAVVILDADTLAVRRRIVGSEAGEGADPFFLADGCVFLDGSWDGQLSLRELDAPLPAIWSIELPGKIRRICGGRHRGEAWIVVGRRAEVWVPDEIWSCDCAGGAAAPVAMPGLGRVHAAAVSRKGDLIAVVRGDGLNATTPAPGTPEFINMLQEAMRDGLPASLELRRTDDGLVVASVAIRVSAAASVAWHPDDRSVACVTRDAVTAFTLPDLSACGLLPLPSASVVEFSPSGEWLAAGSEQEDVASAGAAFPGGASTDRARRSAAFPNPSPPGL